MIKYLLYSLFGLFLLGHPATSFSQQYTEVHISEDFSFDKELDDLLKNLDLSTEQKISIGIVILKHSLEFNYKKYDGTTEMKQYQMINAKINELDKDLKEILDKGQFRKYKKWKKKVKRELRKQ